MKTKNDQTVAKVILNQLGNGRFITMTGAKHLCSTPNSLSFRIPRNKSKANHVRIILLDDDTYKITFQRIFNKYRKIGDIKIPVPQVEEVNSASNIFSSALAETFTYTTGFALTL